jgi:hypothetical protein
MEDNKELNETPSDMDDFALDLENEEPLPDECAF